MTDAERKGWLASLKGGDEVAIANPTWAGANYVIETIERTTATQLILSRGRRFNRDNGLIRGNSYIRISPVTQDVLDDVECGELTTWLLGLERAHKSITLAQLRAMKAAFDREVAK